MKTVQAAENEITEEEVNFYSHSFKLVKLYNAQDPKPHAQKYQLHDCNGEIECEIMVRNGFYGSNTPLATLLLLMVGLGLLEPALHQKDVDNTKDLGGEVFQNIMRSISTYHTQKHMKNKS